MAENSISCVKTEPKIKVFNFTKEHMDKVFFFHVLKLDGSLFFWVGNADKTMKNLCVAVNTRYDDGTSVAALLGDPVDIPCSSLAQRLAKKTKKQCYVSYNSTMDKSSLSFVEETITQQMNSFPQQF